MAYKKAVDAKTGYIAPVDIIKSSVSDRIDEYKSLRDDDGAISIGKSSKIQKLMKDAIADKYTKKKEELESIKNILGDDVDDDDVEKIIKKKKKKGKKKKKKHKNEDTFRQTLMSAVSSDMADVLRSEDDEEYAKKKKKKDKKKKKKLKGLIIKEKKPKVSANGESKKTKEDNGKSEVAQRFKEVEKITRENIQEIDETMQVVNERIKEILKSGDRMRGKDTVLSNYIESKTSLISARQKAATDILSNRAKVYDIEMKKEKNSTAGAASDVDMLARLLPGISINGLEGTIAKHIDESGKNKNGKKKKDKKKKKGGGYEYDDDDELLKSREKELIKSGLLEYSDYDKHIEYEGKFDVAVKKAFTTGEWKFIAVDKSGSILDVPKSMLPSKKVASMKFDDEKDIAIDMNTNQAYRVYSVPSF